ncbi:MAG TPA: O-methyltransferase [Chloroflexota bacterium]|nr:O-methyltransferase [Chloroflexota bacterium]
MTTISEYAQDLYGTTADELLRSLPEEAQREGLPAIHIPDEVGRLLQILILTSGVKRILELGTLFGYSSIWMGRVLPEDGHIVSLEAETRHVEVSRRNHARAGLEGKIEVRTGAALDVLPQLEGQTFDLIFIDADKVNYSNYLDWSLKLAHKGTLIVADNTWRHGDVAASEADESGRAMAEFNRKLAEDRRLLSTLIPTRDCGDAVSVAYVR